MDYSVAFFIGKEQFKKPQEASFSTQQSLLRHEVGFREGPPAGSPWVADPVSWAQGPPTFVSSVSVVLGWLLESCPPCLACLQVIGSLLLVG